jgi:hypothetical protein
MGLLYWRRQIDWRVIRVRILRETGDYITECFRHPELTVQIPAVPADEANWSREFARAFWERVLPG